MASKRLSSLAHGIAGVLLCTYPVLVWLGLRRESPRAIALVLLVLLAPTVWLRLSAAKRPGLRGLAVIPLATIAILGLASVLDDLGLILVVPVAINAILLVTFGVTLRPGSAPMIERFALLSEGSLNDAQRVWCRAWTKVWCVFFVVNGMIAAGLAVFAPVSWWALYTGLLSYLLIGVLFAVEWVWRRRRFGAAVIEGAK